MAKPGELDGDGISGGQEPRYIKILAYRRERGKGGKTLGGRPPGLQISSFAACVDIYIYKVWFYFIFSPFPNRAANIRGEGRTRLTIVPLLLLPNQVDRCTLSILPVHVSHALLSLAIEREGIVSYLFLVLYSYKIIYSKNKLNTYISKNNLPIIGYD